MVRVALLCEVRAAVALLWPGAVVRIFGSCSTDLALPTSDIDIVVQLRQQQGGGGYLSSPGPLSLPAMAMPTVACPPAVMSNNNDSSLLLESVDDGDDGNNEVNGDDTGDAAEDAAPSKPFALPEEETRLATATHSTDNGAGVDYQATVGGEPSMSDDFSAPALPRAPGEEPTAATEQAVSSASPYTAPIHPNPSPQGYAPSRLPLPIFPPPLPQPPLPSLPPTTDAFSSVFFALTSQLYMQPWASQVTPIPTASIPVIKLRAAADVLLSNPDMQRAVVAAHRRQLLFSPPPSSSSLFTSSSSALPMPPPRPSTSLLDHDLPNESNNNSDSNSHPPVHHEDKNCLLKHPSEVKEGGEDSSTEACGIVGATRESNLRASDLWDDQETLLREDATMMTGPIASGDGTDEDVAAAVASMAFDFEQARGVSIAVDVTFDYGHSMTTMSTMHPPGSLAAGTPTAAAAVPATASRAAWQGFAADEFVQKCLRTRSTVLPAVVKMVKGLLSAPGVQLHVPFTGGLSRYLLTHTPEIHACVPVDMSIHLCY